MSITTKICAVLAALTYFEVDGPPKLDVCAPSTSNQDGEPKSGYARVVAAVLGADGVVELAGRFGALVQLAAGTLPGMRAESFGIIDSSGGFGVLKALLAYLPHLSVEQTNSFSPARGDATEVEPSKAGDDSDDSDEYHAIPGSTAGHASEVVDAANREAPFGSTRNFNDPIADGLNVIREMCCAHSVNRTRCSRAGIFEVIAAASLIRVHLLF